MEVDIYVTFNRLRHNGKRDHRLLLPRANLILVVYSVDSCRRH